MSVNLTLSRDGGQSRGGRHQREETEAHWLCRTVGGWVTRGEEDDGKERGPDAEEASRRTLTNDCSKMCSPVSLVGWVETLFSWGMGLEMQMWHPRWASQSTEAMLGHLTQHHSPDSSCLFNKRCASTTEWILKQFEIISLPAFETCEMYCFLSVLLFCLVWEFSCASRINSSNEESGCGLILITLALLITCYQVPLISTHIFLPSHCFILYNINLKIENSVWGKWV